MTGRQVSDLGLHRVVDSKPRLPQAADRLDPALPITANEILIRVDTLNIDSASFAQIVGEVGPNPTAIGARIEEIVAQRGKMQNPVTGSGGMLLGTVEQLGARYPSERFGVKEGDRVATLVSLTLTPLAIERVRDVHLDADQVAVDGHCILWPTSPIVAIPDDLPERVALSVFDVCGAPAQVARLCADAESVAVIGAGKSGFLVAAQARSTVVTRGRIVAVDRDARSLERLQGAGLVDASATVDATDAVGTMETVIELLDGDRADVVINTANVPGTEMAAILSAADGGTVFFFNMATSFSAAALGAEGVGRDVTLIIGNGFVPGHARLALDLVRSSEPLRAWLEELVEGGEASR